MQPILGVYWDISPKNTLKNISKFITHLQKTNIKEVCIMINDMGKDSLLWNISQIKTFEEALSKNNIITSIILWMKPTLASINTALSNIKKIQKEIPHIYIYEIDAEHNWQKSHLDNNFKTLEDASMYYKKELPNKNNVMYGVSVHSGRVNSSISSTLDYVNIQSYSLVVKNDIETKIRKPGDFQKYCYNKISEICPKQDIYFALAAWGQTKFKNDKNEKIPTKQAMLTQYNKALSYNTKKIMYWSAKWIYDHDATIENQYAYDFLANLKLTG